MVNLLNAIRFYKRNIQNPKDMLFILFVAQIGKHLTENEEEGLRKKDIIEFFKKWAEKPKDKKSEKPKDKKSEKKLDRPRAIKAFKNYNYSIVPNKIRISERSIHNYIKKMVKEGVLSPPRKKRYKRHKQTFYYFGYLTRHQIKVQLLQLLYGGSADRVRAQLGRWEDAHWKFFSELRGKYRKKDKKLDVLLSEQETINSKSPGMDVEMWSKQMHRLNTAIYERLDNCMGESEKKKKESLRGKIQEFQKEYDEIRVQYDDSLKEHPSEDERKLDAERNWKKEKQGIISMIDANSWSTTFRRYGTLVFGIKKPYPELIEHHLDWIHYHTECVADLIHKDGGDSLNFLIVARPSVIIRDDKAEEVFGEYFRNYSKTPRSAYWERPPLPEVILKRLKPSS